MYINALMLCYIGCLLLYEQTKNDQTIMHGVATHAASVQVLVDSPPCVPHHLVQSHSVSLLYQTAH